MGETSLGRCRSADRRNHRHFRQRSGVCVLFHRIADRSRRCPWDSPPSRRASWPATFAGAIDCWRSKAKTMLPRCVPRSPPRAAPPNVPLAMPEAGGVKASHHRWCPRRASAARNWATNSVNNKPCNHYQCHPFHGSKTLPAFCAGATVPLLPAGRPRTVPASVPAVSAGADQLVRGAGAALRPQHCRLRWRDHSAGWLTVLVRDMVLLSLQGVSLNMGLWPRLAGIVAAEPTHVVQTVDLSAVRCGTGQAVMSFCRAPTTR